MRARWVLVVLALLLISFPVLAQLKKGSCKTKDDCTLSVYSKVVTQPSECYCPMCPTVVMKTASERNQKSWEQYCSGLRCPMPMCTQPPRFTCAKDGTCRAMP